MLEPGGVRGEGQRTLSAFSNVVVAAAGAVVVYWPLSSWRLDYSGHCEVC